MKIGGVMPVSFRYIDGWPLYRLCSTNSVDGMSRSLARSGLCWDHSILKKEGPMSTILVIILILLLVGALPSWPYSSGWGYYPSGGLGLILLIVIILLLMGRL